MMRRLAGRRRRRVPTWQDWVRNSSVCEQSLRYFERNDQVRNLPAQQAKDNVLGHLKKAFHNLSLANHVYDTNQSGQLRVKYSGESFYDWVITISYYAMYQACLAALAAVRKAGENHSATVCALIHYYVHKKKRLNETYLLSLDTIRSLADQDIQKLVQKRFEREKASYDTSYTTQVGIAQTALSDAREFVLKVREILEDGFGPDFLKDI
jgi:uncharacterized protein (UPF0332 family)